ncbi:Rrf2 family transcriptional regulator [Mucilaginibacter daejeonensis]|uniref:RrF2 family transcriptional regulator n=1 Tax=Mucilaginibacter daejeonensis TaxID=398049 RepID=UPI001D178786|nr:Rrf2 family transcriptional regulator [Mucilaginibacter daejeonensis]UEG51740.1 Rrf2 family transcriptional regulator [Mucilaginibacter daejeonensis]
MSGRFQIAVHILTLLYAAQGELLSSEYMAGSVNVNPALIRKELSALIKAGLVASKEGKNGGYYLGKPAHQITMAQVYDAVDPKAILGQARNMPNPACTIGKQINGYFKVMDDEVQQAVRDRLNTQTLDTFYKRFE